MPLITALAAVPVVASTALAAGTFLPCHTFDYLRVRIKALGGTVEVRPYYELAPGDWWPLRADAVAAAGSANVTANPAVRSGKSDGVFHSMGLSCAVVLVVEVGNVAHVAEAYLDIADTET